MLTLRDLKRTEARRAAQRMAGSYASSTTQQMFASGRAQQGLQTDTHSLLRLFTKPRPAFKFMPRLRARL